MNRQNQDYQPGKKTMSQAIQIPKLSIILLTPDDYATLRKVVTCYSKQTIASDIEIVIVTAYPSELNLPENELEIFTNFQIIVHKETKDAGSYKAAAVNAAKADVVVFGEDHAFPHRDWAENLVKRHKDRWAAVGPLVINPNPSMPISWAQAYMEYGPWLSTEEAGETDYLPGHNSSFKKGDLLEYGDSLKEYLNSEYTLFQDFRQRKKKLYFEKEARIRHLNFEKLLPLMKTSFYAGRNFAAFRSRNWNLLKKLVYFFGSPLIPVVRSKRIIEMMMANQRPEKITFSIFGYLVINLVTDSLGQVLGYALGIGSTKEKLFPFEFHRSKFLKDDSILDEICN